MFIMNDRVEEVTGKQGGIVNRNAETATLPRLNLLQNGGQLSFPSQVLLLDVNKNTRNKLLNNSGRREG